MNVLLINYEYPPMGGGGGVESALLAEELSKNNKVHILTSRYQKQPVRETIGTVTIHRVTILGRKDRDTATLLSMVSFVFFACLYIMRKFRRGQFDIINSWFAIPTGPAGILASYRIRCPHALTICGGDIYDPTKKSAPNNNRFLGTIVGWILNHADVLVPMSNNLAAILSSRYATRTPVEVINVGINEPALQPLSKESLQMSGGHKNIVSCARLVKRKNLDSVIRALAALPEMEYKYWIIGDGPEKVNLLKLIKELHLEQKVFFTGRIDENEKYNRLLHADLFVLPSFHEGLCQALMEAVWARLPIVASKYGGFTDYLQHGKNALLCDAGKIEEISKAIGTLLTDDSLCNAFRAENAIVRERLFVSHVAEKYSELFVKEISGRRDQFREMQRHSSKKFIKHYSNFILPRDNRNHKIKASYILQNLHIKTGDRVLEIGTGTGIHADNFTKAFPEALYTGVDISPDMLETTRARIGNKGTLVLSTGDILDFPDNTFDAVYACSTLHHFKDPFVGISEALRVLKRGGRFVFLEPNRYWVKNFVHALLDRSERGLLKISRNQVDRLLQGLKVNKYTVINFLYTPPIPKAFIPFYNIIDSFQARIPLIKETSIMVGAYGEK